MSRRIFVCSALRTMFTSWMPSFKQILFSIWPRFDAAAVWTSAVWPSRRIVSIMPRAVSGLTKQDAPSAAVVPAGSCRQSAAFTRAVLRVHRAAENRDGLAEQVLRVGASLDDFTGAFIADGQRLAGTRGHGAAISFRDVRGDFCVRAAAGEFRIAHVGRAEQQTDVGRVDRRRVDPHQDFVGSRFCHRHAYQRELKLALIRRKRPQLKSVHARLLCFGWVRA